MKKTLKKLKKPANLPAVKVPIRRRKSAEERVSDALSNVPRITNDTVADHREEVLSSARKFIYPLQHSKNRVVRISIALLVTVVVVFFVAVGLSLYKFQNTSTFMYDITRILPLPVAKAGDSWVSYESYLFELRRNMHYYQKQQQANFETKDGKEQLDRLKRQAMGQAINDAYIKQLAQTHGVTVTDQAVRDQVAIVKRENRLGSNDRVFREVLNEFWGWDEADFRRELKQQLLQQAVVAKLDTATQRKADAALNQVRGGADFAAVAAQVSEDPVTRNSGGQYPAPITWSSRDLPPLLTPEIFKLKLNEVSGVVNTGFTLDIVKVTEITGDSRKASHIQFNLADISGYVKPLQDKKPAKQYIALSN
jgi:SurA N-terminal domain/PPIC-type PPIASE domain